MNSSSRNPVSNTELLQILKAGADVWNNWRRSQPKSLLPSFQKIDLRGGDLAGADLSKLDLAFADMRNANLSRAQLTQTNLTGVLLSSASLANTDLHAATLESADLSRADLSQANLFRADLSSAYLFGADLTGAIFGQTIFGNTNLDGALGLEQSFHQAPSTVGIDTIYRSGGKIPAAFLRGAGAPENFIAYMPSLVGTAIKFYSCFLSYSGKDQDFVQRLYADLQDNGVRCWFAPEDLRVGDRFAERIEDSIRLYDRLLLVLSDHSISSKWVEMEVETAFERERRVKETVLFPIRLDDAVMRARDAWAADIRRTRHIADFSGWKDHESYQRTFKRLLRDLQSEKRREGANP